MSFLDCRSAAEDAIYERNDYNPEFVTMSEYLVVRYSPNKQFVVFTNSFDKGIELKDIEKILSPKGGARITKIKMLSQTECCIEYIITFT